MLTFAEVLLGKRKGGTTEQMVVHALEKKTADWEMRRAEDGGGLGQGKLLNKVKSGQWGIPRRISRQTEPPMQDPGAGAREEYSGTSKGARVAGESEQQGGWQEMRSVRWPGATLRTCTASLGGNLFISSLTENVLSTVFAK